MNLEQRGVLAEALRANKGAIAEEVTDEFLRRHPDWTARYGARARTYGLEDAAFHVEFLAGAIASGTPNAYADYGRWTAAVLAARKIAPEFVVENLEQVGHAIQRHLTPEQRQVAQPYVEAGVRGASQAAQPQQAGGDRAALASAREVFLQAILQGDRRAARTVAIEAVRAGHALLDVYVDVFEESLYEVGRRWERGDITVAQEHMATAVAQVVLAQLYDVIESGPGTKGSVVLTGVQGELHQIGPHIVSDALEADGWSVRFLGSNVPVSGVLGAIEEVDADVLGVSATMLFSMPQVVALVGAVRARFGERPRILLGGAAFKHSPELWRELGADGYAPGVREAVQLARRWAQDQQEQLDSIKGDRPSA